MGTSTESLNSKAETLEDQIRKEGAKVLTQSGKLDLALKAAAVNDLSKNLEWERRMIQGDDVQPESEDMMILGDVNIGPEDGKSENSQLGADDVLKLATAMAGTGAKASTLANPLVQVGLILASLIGGGYVGSTFFGGDQQQELKDTNTQNVLEFDE